MLEDKTHKAAKQQYLWARSVKRMQMDARHIGLKMQALYEDAQAKGASDDKETHENMQRSA